jgi:signal transduction histidine kinase
MEGDPELMRHLLQNLISNAVKYRRPGIRPRIQIYEQEDSVHTILIVEDNGIGIDAKDAQRIFNPFHRLHKDEKTYEGFGIGLALCKQIAESHDGLVKLDTDFKDGSRFVVMIPKQFAVQEDA